MCYGTGMLQGTVRALRRPCCPAEVKVRWRVVLCVGSKIDADCTEKKKPLFSMEYYRINEVARRRLWACMTVVTGV